MMIGEVKKWAKSLEYDVKNSKEGGGYIWKHIGDKEYLSSKDVNTLAKDIFNHMTKDKWKDYQEKFQKLA
jgi:hypothetical protein